ncbi:MAG: hypothetical protein KKI01_10065 [Proteobacteria bacterium]|nr:hypothetical protein [Pseudomonadota bacterium]
MKDIYSLAVKQSGIASAKKEAHAVMEVLKKELQTIDKEREQYGASKILDKKEQETREKYSALILGHYQVVVSADDELAGYKDNWMNIEHILSTRPVSAKMGEHIFKAMDQNNEAVQRLALATELKNCSCIELSTRAGEAMMENRHGELYLIHQENRTRKGSPGWEPIDLTGIKFPDQIQAKKIFSEAKATRLEMAILEKTARGVMVDPLEKLIYGHALEEMEAI